MCIYIYIYTYIHTQYTIKTRPQGTLMAAPTARIVYGCFKISIFSWPLWWPHFRARLSFPDLFLCMSIPAVTTRLTTTHQRPISLIHFLLMMSVIISWAIVHNWAHDRILIECAVFTFDRFFAPWPLLCGLLGLAPQDLDSSTVDVNTWSLSHAPTYCTLRRWHFVCVVIRNFQCLDVVKCCTFDVINHQIFACVFLWLNQWSSCSLNKFLKLIIYFLNMRLCWDGISCTRRWRIPV